MHREAIATFLWGLDDPTLARIAEARGCVAEQILEMRRTFVEETRRVPSKQIRAPGQLRQLAEWVLAEPDRLQQVQAPRLRTMARPPGPAPSRTVVDETGLYPDEADRLAKLLEKPYAALTWLEGLDVAQEAETFLPAEYLRYFAPALAEHACAICGGPSAGYEVEQLTSALAKALPLQEPAMIAADLRRAVVARHPATIGKLQPFGPRRSRGRGWRHVDGAGPGFPKLLVLIAELDGDSHDNRELFDSDAPQIAATLVEHDEGVLNLGWRPENPAAASLYTADAVLTRLQRVAASGRAVLADAARALLEGG